MTKQQLVKWLEELEREHKLYKFYKSKEWLQLRADVMRQHHNECVMCRQAGKITNATTVHHVYHVKDYKAYALSQYVMQDGQRIVNLIPLCDNCHWKVHPEKDKKAREKKGYKDRYTNEERW